MQVLSAMTSAETEKKLMQHMLAKHVPAVKAAVLLLSNILQALTEAPTPSETELAGVGKVLDYVVALIPNQMYVTRL